MERKDYGLIILIVAIVALVGGLIYFMATATTTFEEGKLRFQMQGGWAQSQTIGDFNNTVYSQVTFTRQIRDQSGEDQQAFINVEIRKTAGTVNNTLFQETLLNQSGSSISNVEINEYNFRQYQITSSQVAHEISTMEINNFLIMVEYICPPSIKNETEEAYNSILRSLEIV